MDKRSKKKEIIIDCISDLHGYDPNLLEYTPNADMLIVAGDISVGKLSCTFIQQLKNLDKLPHKHKIIVAGNHDKVEKKLLPKFKNFYYLENDIIEIENLKIGGSPYTPTFFNWEFMTSEGELDKIWSLFDGKDLDILITHGPPLGILDLTIDSRHVGSISLAAHTFSINPRYHIFGHIHEAHGQKDKYGIKFRNVSVLNENYELTNPVTTIKIKKQMR